MEMVAAHYLQAPLPIHALPEAVPRSYGSVQMLNARLSGIFTCRRCALVSYCDTERSRTSPAIAALSGNAGEGVVFGVVTGNSDRGAAQLPTPAFPEAAPRSRGAVQNSTRGYPGSLRAGVARWCLTATRKDPG